jgi:GDP-L-fucose synthase
MKTLVTGGSGLVGKAFSDNVIKTSSTMDLRDINTATYLMTLHEPDVVIHAAAKVGGLGSNMNHKGEFFFDNIMINTNVLEAARRCNVKKVVSFLSTCVFPDNVIYPLTEDQIHNGEPHSSNYSYAYTKRMLDIQARSYREQYGCNFVNLIPTNIYGAYDNFNLDNGHVIPSLIHKCYLAKRDNAEFIIWGSGEPLREFVYSKDVAEITMWAAKNYNESKPLIITTSNEVSIKNVAEIIAYFMEFNGKIIFDHNKPDGQFKKPSSNKKLMSLLPDYEFTSLEQGIKETVSWFINNYKNIRK